MCMRKLINQMVVPLLCFFFLAFLFFNIDPISEKIIQFIKKEPTILIAPINGYQKKENFLFVQTTENFIPYSKEDLKNIFYTVVNNGWDEFTFYCPSEYVHCLEDMRSFSKDQDLLTHLNNFVHPFHGFSNVQTTISENGEIHIAIEYFYNEEQKKLIQQKVESIQTEILREDMNLEEKILTIHDYIIDHTKYDVSRNNNGESVYQSYIAYGPLFQGYATCNGYTDAMALFLTNLGVPNFKVAMTPEKNQESAGHVWNAVYLNGSWLHLDLTWDDPVSSDGQDYLQHKYFLITTEQLKEADQGEVIITEHDFKRNIYLELKETPHS